MLVLSRKLGESIEIGDRQVIVRILGIKRSKVQLGIDAPRDVAIHRSEMVEQYSSTSGTEVHATAPDLSESTLAETLESTPDRALHRERRRSIATLDLDSLLGETVLDDLARVQAEIAALAELVSSQDRDVARQVAAEVVDRLTGIEKSVRLVRRQRAEQPIAAFVDSRSSTLDQVRGHEDSSNAASEQLEPWHESRDDSSTLLRESNVAFKVSSSACSMA